jgi:hypothetical protein
MDWKEARSGIQFIAGIEFGAFAARAFRVSGATVVAWQEGAARVLCSLYASEEQEAQEEVRKGDGERLADICKGAKRITSAIEYERQALEWHLEEETVAGYIKEAVQCLQEGNEKAQQEVNEWIMALAREDCMREAERMRVEAAPLRAKEEEEYRRAFDEEAERLFPRQRQNEKMKRMVNRERFEGVMNRERFEGVTEARNRITRPQASWKVQGESSVSWGGLVE